MPEEGVALTSKEHILKWDEIDKIGKLFVKAGVDKIRLTGGEPTVWKEYMDIISDLGQLNLKSLAMTTNGLNIKRKIPELKTWGLTHLNISIDSLVEAKFDFITRRLNGL